MYFYIMDYLIFVRLLWIMTKFKQTPSKYARAKFIKLKVCNVMLFVFQSNVSFTSLVVRGSSTLLWEQCESRTRAMLLAELQPVQCRHRVCVSLFPLPQACCRWQQQPSQSKARVSGQAPYSVYSCGQYKWPYVATINALYLIYASTTNQS